MIVVTTTGEYYASKIEYSPDNAKAFLYILRWEGLTIVPVYQREIVAVYPVPEGE